MFLSRWSIGLSGCYAWAKKWWKYVFWDATSACHVGNMSSLSFHPSVSPRIALIPNAKFTQSVDTVRKHRSPIRFLGALTNQIKGHWLFLYVDKRVINGHATYVCSLTLLTLPAHFSALFAPSAGLLTHITMSSTVVGTQRCSSNYLKLVPFLCV